MDFTLLPPEVVSGLIYAGPGSSALQEAAQAWTTLSTDLHQTAVSYRNVLHGITDIWQGPSATTMQDAVQPLVVWMDSTAAAVRQSASAAMGAATAYTEARAAVVPPSMITANRSQFFMLVVTNLLGQNTAAIAALEAQYGTMWAQDEAAMNTYQTDSTASVDRLPTFQAAPQVTVPISEPLASIFTPGSFLYDSFQALLSSGIPVDIVALFSTFFGPFLGSTLIAGNIAAQNDIIAGKSSVPSVVYPPQTSAEPARVSASRGSAGRIGPMRVPPSWAQPQQSPAATPFTPGGGKKGEKNNPIGIPFIPAVPVAGGKSGWKKGVKFEDMDYGEPLAPIINRHPSGG